MATRTLRPLSRDLVLPESPRWFDDRLWFSDLFGRRVATVDLDGHVETQVEVENDMPSGLGFLPDGTPIVVLMQSRRLMRLDDGALSVHADLSSYTARTNDMVVGPDGRAYVGGGTPRGDDGVLIVIEPNGESRIAADGIPRPNGIALSANQQTIVYSASDEGVLMALTVGDGGTLSAPRVFANLDGRYPDGLCLDADGAAWVATLEAGFFRVLEGGRPEESIVISDRLAIACVLGGADRTTLFLTSVEAKYDDLAAGRVERSKGFLDVVDADVAGAGHP